MSAGIRVELGMDRVDEERRMAYLACGESFVPDTPIFLLSTGDEIPAADFELIKYISLVRL